MTAGIVMLLSEPPMLVGGPPRSLATMTATAPAAWALATLVVKLQEPRSTRAIAPAGKPTSGPQPSVGSSLPSSPRTMSPDTPVSSGAGPKLAPAAS